MEEEKRQRKEARQRVRGLLIQAWQEKEDRDRRANEEQPQQEAHEEKEEGNEEEEKKKENESGQAEKEHEKD